MNRVLTSRIITVTVAKSRIFYLHNDNLVTESERFANSLAGNFREVVDAVITLDEEDPELFGFFVEYIYRDRSTLSRKVGHYSEYVTLAHLYSMGERLMAPRFQAYCLWRFTELLTSQTSISKECVCELLQIACKDVTERVKEDPLRSHILWYGAIRITHLQNSAMFRQLLRDIPNLGGQLCLWMNQSQPPKPAMLNELHHKKFEPESEYSLRTQVEATPDMAAELYCLDGVVAYRTIGLYDLL